MNPVLNIGGDEIEPVALGTKNDVVLLPLDQGSEFTLFSSSVDNVDNRKPFVVSMEDSMEIRFPVIVVTCTNNCSVSA